MSEKIALQLYSVRDRLPGDFEGTVRKIAQMGYAGVETAGFPGTTPMKAANLFKELGLKVTSTHNFPPPKGEKFEEIKKIQSLLDCHDLVSGFGRDQFKTLATTQVACDEINACNKLCQQNGLTLSIHNHSYEYFEVEGTYPFRYLLEHTDPSVLFELDTYWVKCAGFDPVTAVKEIGNRIHLLHIKDGPGVKDQPNVAVGSGVMDVKSLIEAGKGSIDWLIVEFDRCETDNLVAVDKSYQYLNGLLQA
jgi:sugar phosphate isomerase/epimerase